MTYIYLGDRFTDPKYKKQPCDAVKKKTVNVSVVGMEVCW
jgi:hypothetical protein